MENSSTKVSLEEYSEMAKEVEEHLSVVIFTKENMDADKPVPVVNLPTVRFIGGHQKQGITGNIHGYWDAYRSISVVAAVGVPVEESLSDIGMNARRVVICL